MAAAALQYNLFNDIHSYVTAWIAGYGSDAVVRHVFGSSANLRKIFIKPIKSIKGIDPSWSDIKNRIKIPKKITPLLAEEIGIHLGDGNLSLYTNKYGYKSYRYSITGDLTDEELYHTDYISKLLQTLYGKAPIFMRRKNKNSIETYLNSKSVFQFKTKILGLLAGSKRDIEIPNVIFDNNKFSIRCLTGIFDTDFNITEHLAISGKLHSLKVARQIHIILKRNNIQHVYTEYDNYGRFYIPKKSANVIVKKWKMHNLKHTTKFDVFEKFGVFVPFTTTSERIALLSGKISIDSLKNIIKRRNAKFNS